MHFNNNNHFMLHKALHDKMNELYIYHSLLTFAKSLIGVFVPVYLFKLGYAVYEIIGYSIGASILFLLIIPLAVKLIRKIGFKYTLLITSPFYLSHIIFLNFIPQGSLYFHLSWISFGIYIGLFWPAYHSEVALSGSNRHRSSQMGTFQILATMFGTLAPIVGGYLLDFASYWYLLIFASVLIIVGVIPLMLSDEKKIKRYNFDYKDYIRLLKIKKHKNSKKAFIANGFESILLFTLWPIILFIFLDQSYFKFGSLLTAVSLISVMIILYVKTFFDKGNKNKFLKKSTSVLSFSWLIKSFIIFLGVFVLYFIECIARLSQNIFNMLFMTIFYNNAKKTGYMDYIIFREMYLHLTKITFSLFLIGFLLYFGESKVTLSAIAFSGVFIPLGFNSFKEEI